MNKEQIENSAYNAVGKLEQAARSATANLADAAVSGLGRAKDSLSAVLDEAPVALEKAANQARSQLRNGNAELKRQFGDDAPYYLLAGAVGLAALGIFAMRRR